MKRMGLLLLSCLLAGCGSDDGDKQADDVAPQESQEVATTFTAFGAVQADQFDFDYRDPLEEGEFCVGRYNYSDLVEGAQVVIRDGDGTKVALAELGPGAMTTKGRACIWQFEVPDVPAGGGIYSLDVANYVDMTSFTEEEGVNGFVVKVFVELVQPGG